MANEFVQTMADARADAQSLSDFVFKPSGFKVARRLAPTIDTLQFYIDRFDATKATTDAYIATIPTIVNDAINNTAVEGGILADTFVTVTANGSGSVARNQRGKNADVVSVKDFGALGSGVASPVSHWHTIGATNYRGYANLAAVKVDYPHVVTGNETIDWVAFVAGTEYLTSVGGGCLFVPTGKYMTSANIDIPAKVWIRGAGRGNTVVHGDDVVFHTGFTLTDQNCILSDIFITNMELGFKGSKDARYCKVFNCKVSGNNLGFTWHDGFINSIYGNEVTFNKWGGVITGQSFQFNVYDNVIDNNLGGLGLLVLDSAGAVIRNNTIEGNRIVATGQGVGLAVFGYPQRLVIAENWLEDNGTTWIPDTVTPNPYSCDILLGDGMTEVAVELINKCVPEEYRPQCLGSLSVAGNISIHKNFHFISRHGIMMRIQSTPLDISISDMTFNGTNDGQKPISIEYISGDTGIGQINIDKVFTQVLGGDVSNVRKGIGGSPIHCNKLTPYNLIKVDGVDLYTKRMNCKEFLTLPNATLDVEVRLPASGSSQIKNTVKAQQGVKGIVTNDDYGRVRVGVTPVLNTTEEHVIIGIGKPNGALIAYVAGSPNTFYISEGAANVFSISEPFISTQTEITLATGEYYGYCVMTKTQADIHIKGARRLELTDLLIESMLHKATAPPTSAQQRSYVGEIIYNSNPVEGGAFGWVCVTAGNPGTWKSIGNIGTI